MNKKNKENDEAIAENDLMVEICEENIGAPNDALKGSDAILSRLNDMGMVDLIKDEFDEGDVGATSGLLKQDILNAAFNYFMV